MASRRPLVNVNGALQELADTDTVPATALHAHTHPESDVTSLVSDLAGKAAASHTHPESDVTSLVTDLAAKQSTSAKGAANGYAGLDASSKVPIAQLPTGTSATTVAIGNDSRLSDARTPTVHASSHASGGSDPVSPASIGAAASGHTHPEGDITSLTTDLAAKAPTASPTFTGTATFARLMQNPVALTDAATIATDASLGNFFTVTLTATGRIMGAPSNPSEGQMILYRITQDATGGRTLSFATGTSGSFKAGTDLAFPSPVLSTAAGAIDYYGFIYSSASARWHLLAYARGF